MTKLDLSSETLQELKRRHIAFLEERLVSETARGDWKKACRDGYEQSCRLRMRDVVEPALVSRALRTALSSESVRTLVAPVVAELHRASLNALRGNDAAFGEYVPREARVAIDALLERGDLIPDVLVRKLFEQPAVEDAIHDTLFEALSQFMKTVNPFFAEWGLPAILKRMPIGGSMILASMEAMRGEFDRRLEPEMKRFLAAFSRGTRSQLADLLLARSGDPKLIELRKNLIAFLYTQPIAELLAGVDDEAVARSVQAAEHVVVAVIERERASRGLESAIEDFVQDLGDVTVGKWLQDIGAVGAPDVESWAELMWPQVTAAIRSAPVRELLGSITAEFYDSLRET